MENQVQSSATQGIGWALREECLFDSQGAPMIDTEITEVPAPTVSMGYVGKVRYSRTL